MCAIDALKHPDWRGAIERYETLKPLLERTGLFREFAELAPNESNILAFANQYGLLTEAPNLTIDTEFGQTRVASDTLQLWQSEIRALKRAVELWDADSEGGNKLTGDLKAVSAKNELPLAVRRILHLNDDDPLMPTLSQIQRSADVYLREHVDLRLVLLDNQARLQLRLQPKNLLGALWLQFGLAVDLHKRFMRCTECGAPFEVSRGQHTGKRPDAKYCSNRCRTGFYRGRIEQARRLDSSGLAIKEIARRLETRVSVISRWLKAGQPKPRRRG